MDYIREAVEYLKSYSDLQYAVINLKEEIQKLDAELKGGAMVYSDMPGGGSSATDDKILNKVYRIEMAKKEYAESGKTIRRIDRILEAMNLCEETEKHGDLLRQWFIESRDKEEIAKDMNVTLRHLYRLKEKALKRFAIQIFGINVIK